MGDADPLCIIVLVKCIEYSVLNYFIVCINYD